MPRIIKSNVNYIGSYGHLFSRLSELKELKNEEALDILFIGSSPTYRGFDPRIFSDHGLKTFNLGSTAQTPIQTNILLKRYLKNLNPKTVIIEVNPVAFEIDGVESSVDIIANDKNDLHSLKMALKLNNIKTYNTLINSFICDLLGLNNSFEELVIRKNDKYVSGGFVEKQIDYYKPTKIKKKDISINQYQLESFDKIVKTLKSKNIEVILVHVPITKVKYSSYTNISYFDSLMKGYSKYYNFNEIVSLNDSLHFYDQSHLNQNGVVIFNEKLIDVLTEN